MKALTILLGLLLALPAFAVEPAKATETKPTETPAVAKDAAKGSAIKPGEEEEDPEGAVTVRPTPEGWIPNYRFPKKPESDLFSFNIGANIYWPQASINVLLAKRLSVGLMPFYFKYRLIGVESQHTGALLTVSAYSINDLKGLWVFAGVGASQSKSSFLDGRASGIQPSIILATSVGYRWRWGHFNAGASVGGMYFEQLYVGKFRYRIGVFYPAAIYDIGFSW